jgi:hypothetical protein
MRVIVPLRGEACSMRMCREWNLHGLILMRLTGEMAFGCLSVKRVDTQMKRWDGLDWTGV